MYTRYKRIMHYASLLLVITGLCGCRNLVSDKAPQTVGKKSMQSMGTVKGASPRNILLIMTDEQCADAMSCVGNPYVKTPNIDRLARKGVVFQKAYTTQPLCVPYRTALQTGRWPHQTGVMVNNTRFLPAGVPQGPMLGKMVRDVGYQCGYLGKMHICHLTADGSRSIDLRQKDIAVHGYNPAAECKDSEIAPRFSTFLKDNPSAPFFFTASFDDPHDCLVLESNPNSLAHVVGQVPEDPALLPPLPKNHIPSPDEPEVVKAYWAQMENAREQKSGKKMASSDDWSELQWRQYLWAYYRLVEKVDKDIGHTLDVLEASGRAADTLIIFTVDHGDGAAHRRRRCKQTLYDESARIPFIVSGTPALNKGTIDSTHLVSANDIFPTILDYAGVEKPAYVSGQSLRPLVETGSWKDHPFVITQTLFNKGTDVPGWAGRMVRSPNYKYVLYNQGKGREQLFNMEADPLEMRNLVNDPESQMILKQHREMLERWCRQTNDPFLGSRTLMKSSVAIELKEPAVADSGRGFGL
jgi:arylsulfatase A-like enzyme